MHEYFRVTIKGEEGNCRAVKPAVRRYCAFAVMLGALACTPTRVVTAPAPRPVMPANVSSFTCAPPKEATPSHVELNVVGTLATSEAQAISAELCPRLIEVGYCISIVHGDQPELRGTLDVELDLIPIPVKRVAIVGGTLSDKRLHECVVDALEVTRHSGHSGRLRFTLQVRAPKRVAAAPEAGVDDAKGRLPPEVIKALIKAHFPRFRTCYERLLKTDPAAAGTIAVRFIVERNGAVSNAEVEEASTIKDAAARACVRAAYTKIRFPAPAGGRVMVTYPIDFAFE